MKRDGDQLILVVHNVNTMDTKEKLQVITNLMT